MASQQTTNGQSTISLGQEFTKMVIDATGPKTDPRLREVMSCLIQHIHDFAREINLTADEWMAAVQMINRCGQMSDEKRNEGQLLCDVIGLESLVDDITYTTAVNSGQSVTSSAILGPFYRHDHPIRPNGTTISFDTPADAQPVFMFGRVLSADGKPLANASVEAWQASTNGLYEQQDPNQQDLNLRGKFITDAEGNYSFYCIRPTPYPIPNDGPSGQLLEMLDRHNWRPAHIHLVVQAEGFKPVTTQIFDKDSKYLDDDSVFAVKNNLRVEFVPRKGDPQAALELEYNIGLAPLDK